MSRRADPQSSLRERGANRKPPRLCAPERETLLALLQYQRDSLIRKVEGADEVAVRESAVGSGTPLLWLLKHLARAEIRWVLIRFAALDTRPPDDTVRPGDTIGFVIAGYPTPQVDDVVRAAGLEEVCCGDDSVEPVNLRLVLAHLLEETARHAGHADILREHIDGSTRPAGVRGLGPGGERSARLMSGNARP